MELHLKIIGFLFIVLALIHVFFPAYFNWKKDLSSLSLINRQMMYIHTFFIALFLLLTGLMCATSGKEIIETKLGNKLALVFFIFWFIRLLVQFFGYSAKLWKGKTAETVVHILFSILWTYASVIFFMIYWAKR